MMSQLPEVREIGVMNCKGYGRKWLDCCWYHFGMRAEDKVKKVRLSPEQALEDYMYVSGEVRISANKRVKLV
jgi:hypothetical protein